MLVMVKFETLSNFKSDCFIYKVSTFEENNQKFVKQLEIVEIQTTMHDENTLKLLGQVVPVNPWLALKDLKGYVQACYPTSRVTIIENESLN